MRVRALNARSLLASLERVALRHSHRLAVQVSVAQSAALAHDG
jgi:hypothetical protein